MSATEWIVLAVAAVAAVWPQIGKLFGKKAPQRDLQEIVAEVIRLTLGSTQPPVVPESLDKGAAMTKLLALEGELRKAGFTSSADRVADAAACLLVPTAPKVQP